VAIAHFRIGNRVSRGRNESLVAAAAYIARECYYDERQHLTHNYTPSPTQEASAHDAQRQYAEGRKGALIVGLTAPSHCPDWMFGAANCERAWNAAEATEKRKDAQIAERFNIALPKELTLEQNHLLVKDFVREAFVRRGRLVQYGIHADEHGINNTHVHVMPSLRGVDENGFKSHKTEEQQARYFGRAEYIYGLREL
jgi:hypothetical protein